MKRFFAAFLAAVICLPSFAFAEGEEAYSSREILDAIGQTIEVHSVYGGVNSEALYFETLAGILENHPELYDEALKIMLSATDKYGAYYTKDEAAKLLESLSDSITGIGVTVLSLNGSPVISQVMPGTPAEAAGLAEGDIILFADGVDLQGMDLDAAISHIRGAVGTTVSLTIERSGIGQLTFNIVRDNIVSLPVDYQILDEKIGYIQLYSFTANASQYVAQALAAFDSANIKDIILDLRGNGGGYLDEAVAIADMFLPEGAIITTEDHRINLLDRVYTATGADPGYNTVVLIDGNSASASEVATAALSENGAATVIGEKSYGKGTVQTMAYLPDGGMIKYTTAFYLTPSGNNINEIGIYPNINVINTAENLDLSDFTEFAYNSTYAPGMTAPEIRYAKEMLDILGLYQGEINEYFDEGLRLAIATLQQALNYRNPTGTLDPFTQINIYLALSQTKVVVDNQLAEAKAYLSE